jgi:uncharacterized membrane protein
MRGIIARVFPRARRRVTVMSALPLGVFLVAFFAAWLFLELDGVRLVGRLLFSVTGWSALGEASLMIRFARPAAFALLVITPWVWWMHVASASGLARARAVAALMVRFVLIGVFVMFLARPRSARKSDVLAVMYAVDLSDSIGERSKEEALGFVAKTVTGKPEKDKAGLAVFGRDAAVELPPRISFPLEGEGVQLNSRIARDGTNLERALSLSLACIPEEDQGRIVLVTDGTQTEGTVAGILDDLASRKVAVDVLPIDYDFPHEVWLERLELPRFVKSGETYEASVILSSLQDGRGKLSLTENGERVFGGEGEGEVEFGVGRNRYTLPLYLRGPGYYEYVAKIEVPPGSDGWRENNVAVGHLYLKGKGRTLVVTDPQCDTRDWRTLVKALERAGLAVELKSAYEFPREALSLMPYDCIVFPNVPADALDIVQMQAVRDAVYSQGIGFLMVGGKNSYGPGGYHRSPVEEALPVTMDVTQKKVLPKGALAIVLHTCEFAEGNTWGKRIAKEAIRVLGAEDEVGVLVFDWSGGGTSGYKWLFKLTRAGDYEKLVPLINKAQIGDMPDFGSTMTMGLAGLKASDAAMKHMIIISDGDPQPPTPALVNQFVLAKISVTTVAINPHGGQEVAVMRTIAGATGGRYYFPKDPKQLPSIFIKEAKTLRRSMIQNKTFTPTVEFPSSILKGIEGCPELHGYVLTTAKPRSTTILKGPETEQLDPVLATWRHGLGKSAAFTSDLSPNWARSWVVWDRYRAFVKQLVIDISRVEKKTFLRMRAGASGTAGVITIEDYNPEGSFLEVEGRVSGPRGRSVPVSLRQVGARRYRGKFNLWGKGRYQVQAMGAGDGRSETAMAGFAVPYSPEYRRFRSDPIILGKIAEKTGGRILKGDETGKELFGKDRKPKESSRSVEDIFLIILACLVPLDVGFRRIQIDWRLIKGWIGLGRKGPSDRTLGALLRVKRRMKAAAGEKEEAASGAGGAGAKERVESRARLRDLLRSPIHSPPSAAPAPGKKPAPAEKKEKAEEADIESLPTTARLLALKRKREQERGGDK